MTATSKDPKAKPAALGIRAHSGWAAAILLAGPSAAPQILERRRITLCDPATEGSKQPFHHAEPMRFPDADRFIANCTESSGRYAREAVTQFIAVAKTHRCKLDACGILTASGRALPDLGSILASHALIHAAEGEFYRDAMAHACEHENIAVSRVKEREIERWIASRVCEKTLKSALAAMGQQLGPPWTADEKHATMIAWLVLDSAGG